jgi:hypothetical protein
LTTAGPAPPTGGSDLRGGQRSHGQLQSLLLPPSLLLLLRRVGGRTGEWVPSRRLGLGDPHGLGGGSYSSGRARGHVDGRDAPGDAGRTATARPRPARAALALAISQSGKGRGMMKATSARPQRDEVRGPLASHGAPRGGRWRLAGSVFGRGWAGRQAGLELRLAARQGVN